MNKILSTITTGMFLKIFLVSPAHALQGNYKVYKKNSRGSLYRPNSRFNTYFMDLKLVSCEGRYCKVRNDSDEYFYVHRKAVTSEDYIQMRTDEGTEVTENPFENYISKNCQASCGGVSELDVRVDLEKKCMCVGRHCFKVGIGRSGPGQTRTGIGTLSNANGAKYQTLRSTSNRYDKDAVAMGILSNDRVGKWLHKPRNCVRAETYRTKGCIAVPCNEWHHIKNALNEKRKISVCRGISAENYLARTSHNQSIN